MPDDLSDTFDQDLKFLRQRDYKLIRTLGRGACGRTVLLLDDVIDAHFVCKKCQPVKDSMRESLFAAFIREIKLLHQLHHENVVRVFNYYVYPDHHAGYILMEHIDGANIEEYVKKNPEQANELFLQAIEGFAYLERAGVLHRDVRPQNIMVTSDGALKIIDLGFGKRVVDSADFEKSVDLNWWCEPPEDFTTQRYDFATEVYFVGKLFERLVRDNGLEQFHYADLLLQMCSHAPEQRVNSFVTVARQIHSDRFAEIKFSQDDLEAYRMFADAIERAVSKIESDTKYLDDIVSIRRRLSEAYRSFMLETHVPNSASVTRCFLDGAYYYNRRGITVAVVKRFLTLLKSCSEEQAQVILANLHTRLDAVERYTDIPYPDDDVPF